MSGIEEILLNVVEGDFTEAGLKQKTLEIRMLISGRDDEDLLTKRLQDAIRERKKREIREFKKGMRRSHRDSDNNESADDILTRAIAQVRREVDSHTEANTKLGNSTDELATIQNKLTDYMGSIEVSGRAINRLAEKEKHENRLLSASITYFLFVSAFIVGSRIFGITLQSIIWFVQLPNFGYWSSLAMQLFYDTSSSLVELITAGLGLR